MSQHRKFVGKLRGVAILAMGFFLLCGTPAGAAHEPNWRVQAEFYSSNYPNRTNNEKAAMLASDMERSNESFEIVRKYYETELVCVYQNGMRIWPPHDCMVEKYKGLKFLNQKVTLYRE